MLAAPAAAHAQAFSDVTRAVVDYSKANTEPRKTCEAIGRFSSKNIAQIASTMVPGDPAAPEHCRVTGLLSPEIAFEVSLPSKWNGRFYMIGNGGYAGEAIDDHPSTSRRALN